MNKKLLLLFIIPALLLFITGCDKKEEKPEVTTKTIELTDNKLGFKTTFTYNSDLNYSKVKEDDSGASKAIDFYNEDLDVNFEMYYNTISSNLYKSVKESRNEQKYYKEYKFGDYEAYAYGNYENGLYLNILLSTEENGMVNLLFVSIDRIDNNEEAIVSEIVAGKEVQELLNTIKFEKIEKANQ